LNGRQAVSKLPFFARRSPCVRRRAEVGGRIEGDVVKDRQYVLRPIGRVESALVDRETAPKQGGEGSPGAWLVFEPGISEGLRGLRVGDEVIVLTWLDRARRDVLAVHPRGDAMRPETGVFNTRSPDRPNPIGLHRVRIVSIEDTRMCVRNLEALDATPVIDVKPVLDPGIER
jgi:tRNA-Thr(GGU) m(6)t(6)A37 methyltransferase TsaA